LDGVLMFHQLQSLGGEDNGDNYIPGDDISL
jgi:hypothetical protein